MELMKPALRDIVVERLESAGVLLDGFDREHDNLYNLALFNSSDLRGDLRAVVGYWWREMDNNRKPSWSHCADQLNVRHVMGQSRHLHGIPEEFLRTP